MRHGPTPKLTPVELECAPDGYDNSRRMLMIVMSFVFLGVTIAGAADFMDEIGRQPLGFNATFVVFVFPIFFAASLATFCFGVRRISDRHGRWRIDDSGVRYAPLEGPAVEIPWKDARLLILRRDSFTIRTDYGAISVPWGMLYAYPAALIRGELYDSLRGYYSLRPARNDRRVYLITNVGLWTACVTGLLALKLEGIVPTRLLGWMFFAIIGLTCVSAAYLLWPEMIGSRYRISADVAGQAPS